MAIDAVHIVSHDLREKGNSRCLNEFLNPSGQSHQFVASAAM